MWGGVRGLVSTREYAAKESLVLVRVWALNPSPTRSRSLELLGRRSDRWTSYDSALTPAISVRGRSEAGRDHGR